MRIIKDTADIDYEKTQQFFKNRAGKFQPGNPYSVTMYQEVEKLYPLLNLGENSRVLDVACGIGRWADAITDDIEEYCGVDFSGELIEIAKKRNRKKNYCFYNVMLMIGILMYLNDRDMRCVLEQAGKVCGEHAVICIREPIGICERLTLKDFYSEELKDNYNAIYRTREEILQVFDDTLFKNGFRIREEGFLFEEINLNNRKETAQYYYILKGYYYG